MIKVEAIIDVDDLDEILLCISGLEISMLNFYEINSIGHDVNKPTIYRGVSHSSAYSSKIKLEILTTMDQVKPLKVCIEKLIKENSKIQPVEICLVPVSEVFQIL